MALLPCCWRDAYNLNIKTLESLDCSTPGHWWQLTNLSRCPQVIGPGPGPGLQRLLFLDDLQEAVVALVQEEDWLLLGGPSGAKVTAGKRAHSLASSTRARHGWVRPGCFPVVLVSELLLSAQLLRSFASLHEVQHVETA